MNDTKKSKIWVYAVILFMSAFIVLLLTAYSQIKLNKNLSDYKNQVYSKESENKKVRQNFSSAQEMNAKLNEEIKELQEENDSLNESVTGLETEKNNLVEKASKKDAAVNSLARAVNAYLDGNIVECAGMMNAIDTANLDGTAAETYKVLSAKVKAEAGEILLDEGYAAYKKEKFSEALPKLALSYQYAPSESYSDKCLFYLAYTELKLDDKAAAIEHMNQLIAAYPESGYLKSAKRFVDRYE
jgi:TolA-binding protein